MKELAFGLLALAAVWSVEAKTVHRSLQNGYPVVNGVPARRESSAAVFKSPKASRQKTVVATNRVTLTKEQAEKLLKAKSKTGARIVRRPRPLRSGEGSANPERDGVTAFLRVISIN